MLIIVAVAVPTETEIQQEIQRIQASPEGQDVFNQELLRDMAVSNLRRKDVSVEDVTSPGDVSYQQEPSAPAVPEATLAVPEATPQVPSLETETPEATGTTERAQQLYQMYQASANDDEKTDIVNQILLLPYHNKTLGEWMSEEVIKAESLGQSKGINDWIYESLDTPNVNNFLAFLTSKSKYFKKAVDKSQKNFSSYIDQNGNVVGDMIPRHLKQGTNLSIPNDSVFRLAKSRIMQLPSGKQAFTSVRYMGKDMSSILKRFNSLDDVEFSKTEDARVLNQYLEDLMVAESYKWNRWEYQGQYQDLSRGFVPPGNEGSRTYNAFENLNRVYSLVAPLLGLPLEMDPEEYRRRTTLTPPPSGDPRLSLHVYPISVVDPTDKTLSKETKTFRTEKKSTLATLSVMLNNLVRNVIGKLPQEELNAIQESVNASLPKNQHISLQKNDYAPRGKFFVEDRMVSTSKYEIGPSYVQEQRQRATGQFSQVSTDVTGTGEEGESTKHEISNEEARGRIGLERSIPKPILYTSPKNFADSYMAPSIAKEMFGDIKSKVAGDEEGLSYEQSIPDPTWDLIKQIQDRAEELKKTLPTTPQAPQDALVYPIRPIGQQRAIRVDMLDTPEQIQQGDQEMRQKLVQMLSPDAEGQAEIGDPVQYIKTLLEGITKAEFEVRPVKGRYLYIKPIGLKEPKPDGSTDLTPEQKTEALAIATKNLSFATQNQLPNMSDEAGRLTAPPEMMQDVIRGYVSSTKNVKDLPKSFRAQYKTFIDEQASQLAREEIMRTVAPEYAKKLNLPENEFTKKIDEFYKTIGESNVLKMLNNRSQRSIQFSNAANRLYGKNVPFDVISREWNTYGDTEKSIKLKSMVAHTIASGLTSQASLDPIIDNVFGLISTNENVDSYLMSKLTQSEKRGGAGLKQATYKLVSEVIGEMIGNLIKENPNQAVQAAISLLRMVRLAVSSRMMKMG